MLTAHSMWRSLELLLFFWTTNLRHSDVKFLEIIYAFQYFLMLLGSTEYLTPSGVFLFLFSFFFNVYFLALLKLHIKLKKNNWPPGYNHCQSGSLNTWYRLPEFENDTNACTHTVYSLHFLFRKWTFSVVNSMNMGDWHTSKHMVLSRIHSLLDSPQGCWSLKISNCSSCPCFSSF